MFLYQTFNSKWLNEIVPSLLNPSTFSSWTVLLRLLFVSPKLTPSPPWTRIKLFTGPLMSSISKSSETLIMITVLKLIEGYLKCHRARWLKDSRKILLKNPKLPNISQNSRKITIFGTSLTLSLTARWNSGFLDFCSLHFSSLESTLLATVSTFLTIQ